MKQTLKSGALVFGASAIFLAIAPDRFLELLDFESTPEMIWSMRILAITLFALAGNMWQNAKLVNNAYGLRNVALVMTLASGALGLLTMLIPTTFTPVVIIYAVIGFTFAITYLINIFK